jgi:hypothetical protein
MNGFQFISVTLHIPGYASALPENAAPAAAAAMADTPDRKPRRGIPVFIFHSFLMNDITVVLLVLHKNEYLKVRIE